MLYEACRNVSLYLDKEWKIESLEELYDRDQEHWKNLHVYLHEGTLDYVLRKLEALLPQLVKKALQLVSDTQAIVKPKVFIGSSVESLDVAYALQENLEHDGEITVWPQGVFDLSKYSLDALIDALDNFDFGVFVFAPDDVVKIREKEYQSTRDNVVFELGLFVGRLGKERSFLVIPREQEDFRLPTDLLGLTPATYEPNRQDDNLSVAAGLPVIRSEKRLRSSVLFRKRWGICLMRT